MSAGYCWAVGSGSCLAPVSSRACAAIAAVSAALAVVASASSTGPTGVSVQVLGWVPNGPVTGVARVGDRLLLGGSFTRVGPRTGPAAIVSSADGRLVPGFPEFAGGAVRSIVSDGAGGWFVGGDFRFAGGLPRAGLAHVLANLTVDRGFSAPTQVVEGPFASPGGVAALALAGRTLYVAGRFNRIGGVVRNGLAAVDAGSGAAFGWDPGADQADVRALAVSGSSVYVSGFFSRIGGALRSGAAAIDAVTAQANRWNPASDGSISTLIAAGDTVYVGGSFMSVGGAGRRYLAAVDAVSGAATAWAPTLPAPVTALALAGGTVYAGLRTSSRERAAPIVAAVSRASGRVGWTRDGDGDVATMALFGARVAVGGSFDTIGAEPRDGVAELAAATGDVVDWAPHPDRFADELGLGSAVRALAEAPAGVVIGGDFAAIGGVRRVGLAAVDTRSGKPTAWTAGLNGRVAGIASAAGRVYVVGAFTRIAGARRSGAAALDTGLRLLRWAPPALEPPGTAANVSVVMGKVLVIGFFNGVAHGRGHGSLAAFDPGSGRLLDWGPPHLVGNGVSQVLAGSGRVYAIGVDGTTDTVAILDRRTGRLRGYLVHNRGTGDVRAAALAGRTLYIGGAIEAVNFEPVERLAAVDARTGKLRPWRPRADGMVVSLLARKRVVYAGGEFRHANGRPRTGIAAIDAGTGRVLPWDPQLSGNVNRLGTYRGGFYASGQFLSAGPRAQPFLALFAG